jgi:hypothetical protein
MASPRCVNDGPGGPACGATDPARFAPGERSRCRECRNLDKRAWHAARRTASDPIGELVSETLGAGLERKGIYEESARLGYGGDEMDTDTEPEGLDEDEDSSWGDYPIDTMLIRNEARTVHDVLRRIALGSYVMDPDFQRDFIWEEDKQSKLIESVLMRIPLPVLYLAEDSEGRMIVVDGLQRLSTFQSFVNNQLRLKLPNQPELNKKLFRDLSPKLQNRVEDCNLILYVIDSRVPERARLDIFERVNGGVPLTRQQMRNCLFTGQATRFLKQETRTDLFVEATGRSLRRSTMRDREFVNRFCAFTLLHPDTYRGDMDEFLAEALRLMNAIGQEELGALSAEFRASMQNNLAIFGQHAFRKPQLNSDRRSVINASLWDVMSTGLAPYSNNLAEKNRESIVSGFARLMDDPTFLDAITYGTNDVRRVTYRFNVTRAMLHQVFDA